jgi:hypothetical protein
MPKEQKLLKEHQKLIKEKKKYKTSLLKKTHLIVKKFLTKYKKLNKKEKEILGLYKWTYYQNINNYLTDNYISFKNLEDYFIKKENININKFQNFTLVNNKSNKNKKKTVFNLMNLFTEYKNNIDKEINFLNSIITKYGETDSTIVYRGITEDKKRKNNFYKEIIKASKKKGNKIFVKNFQSTSLDIFISESFTGWRKNKGILLEINTNNIPYIYIPFDISKGKLNKEKLYNSEFELLLPMNIEMEYLGKKKLKQIET